LPRDLQANIRRSPQQRRRAHEGPREHAAAPPVGMFEPSGQLLVGVAGLRLGDELTTRRQQLGAPIQQPGRLAADTDIAVREQHGGPAARPGQRIEHRAAQGGRPGLAGLSHRDPRDVHPQRWNSPFGQRHSQPPRAAADVQDRTVATPEQFLVD
jgi:hypothetical protein